MVQPDTKGSAATWKSSIKSRKNKPMPIAVNTNSSATTTSFNLSKSNEALRKSLGRLSSGKRITSPADDADGLAMDSGIAPWRLVSPSTTSSFRQVPQ